MGVRVGDVLLGLNNQPLTRPQDITDLLAMRDAAGSISLVLIDDIGDHVRSTWTPDSPPSAPKKD